MSAFAVLHTHRKPPPAVHPTCGHHAQFFSVRPSDAVRQTCILAKMWVYVESVDHDQHPPYMLTGGLRAPNFLRCTCVVRDFYLFFQWFLHVHSPYEDGRFELRLKLVVVKYSYVNLSPHRHSCAALFPMFVLSYSALASCYLANLLASVVSRLQR